MALPLLQLSNSSLQEAIIRPHILSKLILCIMLHAGFPPQADYFWEISDKIVFSLLLSGNIFFQKLCGPFFWMKVWQFHKLCLLLSYKIKHEGSQGRRLCNSSFFSGGSCLSVTGSFSEGSVLVVCVSPLAVLTRLYACQMLQ